MYASIVREHQNIFRAGIRANMIIEAQFRKCVSFLFVDIPHEVTGNKVRTPAATTFFVSVPIETDIEQIYAVTARHVLNKSRKYGNLYIRLQLDDETFKDIDVPQDKWICHPKTDVAVIPIEIPDNSDIVVIPFKMLVTEESISKGGVEFGDDVFFVGLFSEYSGKEHNRPIVRFGNVSLMHEEMPLVLDEGNEPKLVDAYLVESRSWGGHSGAPAFVYYPINRKPGLVVIGGEHFALLGLVHGHHEIKQDIAFIGDILGSGTVPVNAGIAVVIPAQKIIDTLMMDELVQSREDDLKKYKENIKVPKPDDGLMTDENQITREQFHSIIRKAAQPIKKEDM